jgi:hypothetical protein
VWWGAGSEAGLGDMEASGGEGLGVALLSPFVSFLSESPFPLALLEGRDAAFFSGVGGRLGGPSSGLYDAWPGGYSVAFC